MDQQDNQQEEQKQSSVDRINNLARSGRTAYKRYKRTRRAITAARTAFTAVRAGAAAAQGIFAASSNPVGVVVLIIIIMSLTLFIVLIGGGSTTANTPHPEPGRTCSEVNGTCKDSCGVTEDESNGSCTTGVCCVPKKTCQELGGTCKTNCGDPENEENAFCTVSTYKCCVPKEVGDLLPGEFKPPFRRGFSYQGSSYVGHSAYSVDFNRGAPGVDDGDPVFASANGRVVDYYPPNGQVTIRHVGGYETLYAHMKNVSVRDGDTVKLCQQIGEIDNVGDSQGSHLHARHLLNGIPIRLSYNNNPYPASLNPSQKRAGPLVKGECP